MLTKECCTCIFLCSLDKLIKYFDDDSNWLSAMILQHVSEDEYVRSIVYEKRENQTPSFYAILPHTPDWEMGFGVTMNP